MNVPLLSLFFIDICKQHFSKGSIKSTILLSISYDLYHYPGIE